MSDAALDKADLDRIRAICSRFPETEESVLQDRPLFRVRRRRYAIFNGALSPPRKRWAATGRSLHFATAPECHEVLKQDPRFYGSPHHGFRGWMATDLCADTNWAEINRLLESAYRHVAARELVETLDAHG